MTTNFLRTKPTACSLFLRFGLFCLTFFFAIGVRAQTTATQLSFERIYASGGSNYANGTYDGNAANGYVWTRGGGSYSDAANSFSTGNQQTSDDGFQFAGSSGSYTINFVRNVTNLRFSFSDIDGDALGTSGTVGNEQITVNAYTTNGTLLNAKNFVAFRGNRVAFDGGANQFTGNDDRNLDEDDPDGTLRLDFGNQIIDRIEISWRIERNATLRMQEPVFNAFAACPPPANNTTSTVTISEAATKTLTATPAGGTFSIVSGGGTISGSTYTPANVAANTTVTIRYTIAGNSSCPGLTDDVSFVVTPCPVANNTTSTVTISEDATKTLTGTPAGGTFSIVSGGGTISGTTYTPADVAANTTVTIRYTIPASGTCAASVSTISFTVTPCPVANNTTSTVTISEDATKTLTGTPAGGTFSIVSGGGTISGTTYTPADVAANTTVTIRYTVPASGTCAASVSTISFTVTPCPVANNTTSTVTISEDATKTLTATPAGGTFSIVSGGGTISGTTYTPADVAANTTVTIRYTIPASGTCAASTSNVSFVVTPCPVAANTTATASITGNGTKTLSGTPAGGTFSIVSGGGTISGTTYTAANVAATTTVTIRYTIPASGTCAASTADVSFTVTPACPTITNVPNNNTDPTTCSGTDGSIKICGLKVNLGGYVVTFNRNNSPQPQRTLTSDASGCVTISGLGSGIYSQIRISQPVDCPGGSNTLGPITLLAPNPATITKGSTQNTSACGVADGFIQITGLVLGTDYVLTYDKDAQSQTPISFTATSTSYTIQGLTSGVYTNIQVTNNGCVSNSLNHTLADPTTPTINVTASTNPTLCSGNDGTFVVSGLAPATYTLLYNKGDLSQTPITFTTTGTSYTVFGLTRGTYSNIRVISSGCVSNSATVSLSDPGVPVINLGTPNQPSSCGASDGSITISGLNSGVVYKLRFRKNGISQTPVTFTATGSSYTVNGLPAALYSDIYVDQGGCRSNTLSQMLRDPGGATIAAAVTATPSLCGANNGSITISGLTNGLSYILNYVYNGVQQTPVTFTASGTTYVLSALTAGSYNGINVTQGGCVSNSINALVSDPNGPAIAAEGIDARTCSPGNDGAIIVTGLAQNVSYTLNYDKDGVPQSQILIPNTNSTSYVISGLTAGTYTRIRVNQGSCVSNQANVIVAGPVVPSAPLLPATLRNTCPAVTADLTSLSATNNPGLTLNWHTSPVATASNLIPNPEDVGAGTYYGAFFNSTTNCYGATSPVVVTVISCARPPVAVNDVAVTPQDKPVNGNVLTNDSDPEGGLLTVGTTPVSAPGGGTVVLNANGTYTYTPNPGVTGKDQFCYEVTDSQGLTDIACVTIDILANPTLVNEPPVAVDDNTTTAQGTPVVIAVEANDRDPEGLLLANPTALTPPLNGTVVYNPNGTVTYTPNPAFTGTDRFTYQICEDADNTQCGNATVTVIVTEPVTGNQPPVAVDDAEITRVNTPISSTVNANDGDPDGNTPLVFTKLTDPANGTVTFNSNGTYTYTPANGFSGNDSFTYRLCDSGTPNQCDNATVTIAVLPLPSVALSPKVYLQGALYGVNAPDMLMRDDLRSKGLVPLNSPYPGLNLPELIPTGPTTSAVLNTTGPNAIVDWVYLELRDNTNPTLVLKTRSALLQRDGDIVDVDGVSPVVFTQTVAGSYYLVVKHRNHLGVMSANAIPLSAATTTVDFRSPVTPTYNLNSANITNQPQVVVTQGVAMWAGNALFDSRVIYQGNSNDVNPIYQLVLNDAGNVFKLPQYKLRGYRTGDIDMNGETVFQGTGNDLEFIYQNIISNHPGNIFKQNFFIIREQLPQAP